MRVLEKVGQTIFAGADPGEVKWVNFQPPFSEPPSFFFLYPSNTSTRLWFYYIMTKIQFTPRFKILDPRLICCTRIKCKQKLML